MPAYRHSEFNKKTDGTSADMDGVSLCRIPYPYKAVLAICSDLDETPDRHVFWEIMRFLNTTETTTMGPGVGLEVANSIYFDQPAGEFSYWNTDHAGREMLRTLMKSGFVDCLHSFGDMATSRTHAGRALDELSHHGCCLPVWIDHRVAPTNFDPDIMRGHGDEPGHPAYHADLTIASGTRYVWRGRVTSLLGQDIPPHFSNIFKPTHPIVSAKTLGKELIKHVLARVGNQKYAIHAPNRVLQTIKLRDGQPVYEFLRANCHWGGPSSCDTGREIGNILTESMLDLLVHREGALFLYTHLGKVINKNIPFGESARQGFHRLAKKFKGGDILVTTTYRLLRYFTVRDNLRYHEKHTDGRTTIMLEKFKDSIGAPYSLGMTDFEGITFSLQPCERVELMSAEGVNIPFQVQNRGGKTFVFVPWKPLVFPSL